LALPKGSNSNLLITKYDAQKETDAVSVVNFLKQNNILQLDVVIANAGIANDYNTLATVPFTALKDHVEINAYGPLLLFQAVKPFLDKTRQPKFVALGSPVGSIGGMEMCPLPMGAYGASKAMLHYIMRKLHFENENLISFPIDPGWV
jgi:norsolorinic acid ketoreductase